MILETAKMAVKLPDKTYADFILRGVNQFYRKHTHAPELNCSGF